MAQQLLSATEIIEQQVDAQLQQLDQLGEDDFDALRLRRLEGMKRATQQRQEWIAAGHGNVRMTSASFVMFFNCFVYSNSIM